MTYHRQARYQNTFSNFLFLPAFLSRATATVVNRGAISTALIVIAFAAIVGYIAAVNAMLIDGEALKDTRQELSQLQQDLASLQTVIAQKQSPAWVDSMSRSQGMVEVAQVRYISQESSSFVLKK